MSTQTLTRKIQIKPVGDKEERSRVWEFIRDGLETQNLAYNIVLSNLFTIFMKYPPNLKKKDNPEMYAERLEEIKTFNKLAARMPDTKLDGGSFWPSDVTFPKGLASPSSIVQRANQDVSNAVGKGLLYGRMSLPSRSMSAPLITEGRFLTLYHEYKDLEEFKSHLYGKELKLYIKWINGIVFECILGNPYRSGELRTVLSKIIEGENKICGSSISIKGSKLFLNLSIEMPVKEKVFDPEKVAEISLGEDYPVVCKVNYMGNRTKFIGNPEAFILAKNQRAAQRSRTQGALRIGRGGHGRKKKMAPMDRFQKKERNYVKTYNHYLSHNIIKYALDMECGTIEIPKMTDIEEQGFLGKWAYYELQEFIKYKAEKHGIAVKTRD